MIKTLLYYLMFISWYLLSLLPLRVLYVFSDILFPIMYYVARYRRHVVRENLHRAFPERSEHEIIGIERKFYHFFCDYIIETIKLFSISEKEMHRRMQFRGVEEAEAFLREHESGMCFVFLGHFGNWEWISSLGSVVSSDIHCAQIYHPLHDVKFDALFLRLRERFKSECITMNGTLRRILQLKREGKRSFVGFISDQQPKWTAIHYFSPFMHTPTAVFTGAEQIGKKVKACFVFLEVTRPRRGYYECTIRPMTVPEDATSPYPYTDLFMNLLEQQIRKHPELWLWAHKRWSRTKEEYDAMAEKEPDERQRVVRLARNEWLRKQGLPEEN